MNKTFQRLILVATLCVTIKSSVFAQEQALSRQDSGMVLHYLSQHEEELANGDLKEASRHLNETAFIFWDHNQFQKAIDYYEQSLILNEQVGNENGLAMINNNLGMLYSDIENYEKSYHYLQQTLASRRSKNETLGIISALVNISISLNNLNRFDESIKGLEEALILAREVNDAHQMKSCYGMLADTHEQAGNIDKSLHYFELYRSFHELLQKEEIGLLERKVEEEKLLNLLAQEKAEVDQQQLMQKQLEISAIRENIENYNQQISYYDSINRDYAASLNKKQLELELLEWQNKANELKLKEESSKLKSEKSIRNLSVAIVILLFLVCIVVLFEYSRYKKSSRLLAKRNEEIKVKQNMIVKSEKMSSLGVLATGVAHEINNPLNFIKNGLAIIKSQISEKDKDWESKYGDALNIIDEGVKRSVDIVSSLSFFSKSSQKIDKQDVNEILKHCLDIVQHKFITKIIAETEWDEDAIVDGNEGKLHQAFINIITNSLDAMEETGGKLTVKSVVNEDLVKVIIKDTGIGMSEEDILKVGDPFYTTKEVGKGTGLGFYVSNSIIEDHKGTINISSRNSIGTEIEIVLPRRKENQ